MGNLFLQEAFQELNILNEEDFNLGEIDSFKDAKEFNETEDEIDFTDVIDPEAETEDELKDSYIGDVILDCTVCHSKLYKNPEEVHFDEVEGLANTDEECPYCYSTDGYTIIGEVAPYGEKEEEVEETEDEEEIEESFKRNRKLTEGKNQFDLDDIIQRMQDMYDSNDYSNGEIIDYLLDDFDGNRKELIDLFNHYIDSSYKESFNRGLKEAIGIEMKRLTPDQIKQLKVGSTKYYCYHNPANDYTDYSKVRVLKIGSRPIAGHIHVVIRDLQDGHDDQVVYANDLANAIYKSYDESLKEGISIQKGMTIKYDVDGNGTPDSCKVVDFKKGTNGQVAYVILQPPKGDPIRVSADSLVRSNEKPVKKESFKRNRRNSMKESITVQDVRNNNGQFEIDGFTIVPGKNSYHVYNTDLGIDREFANVGRAVNFVNKCLDKNESLDEDVNKSFITKQDVDDARSTLKKGKGLSTGQVKRLQKLIKDYDEQERKRKGIKEHFEKVEIETEDQRMEMTTDDNGKVTVTTNPKTTGEEVIAPVSDEIQSEINPKQDEETASIEDEADVDISEFSEEDFDNLGESYLKKVYENVNSFKTSSIKAAKNKLVIEGIIGFTSGKNKKTSFVFESKDIDKRGRLRFIGENLQLSRGKKSFTLTGSLNNGKFIAESLNYNYRQKDSNGNSTRVYGTVRK